MKRIKYEDFEEIYCRNVGKEVLLFELIEEIECIIEREYKAVIILENKIIINFSDYDFIIRYDKKKKYNEDEYHTMEIKVKSIRMRNKD